MSGTERNATTKSPKRRYRKRRFCKDLDLLRPVTADIVRAYAERAPERAGGDDALICFVAYSESDGSERLAIVAFGRDSQCHVVDLGYRAGEGGVDRLPHRVDLRGLRASVAYRRRRGRVLPPDELARLLLIRFSADINPQLHEGAGGGAFMAFRDAWNSFDLATPTDKTRLRIKRRLETITWSDPLIPGDKSYCFHIHADRDSAVADQYSLRRWLSVTDRASPPDGGHFWSDDPDILTDRFIALAWHILDVEGASPLLSTYWDRDGDRARSHGFSTETEPWHVRIDRRPRGCAQRVGKRLRKLLKPFLEAARRDLASKMDTLDWSRRDLVRNARQRLRLIPWAECRWLPTRPERITQLVDTFDKREASDLHWVGLVECDVVEARRWNGLLRIELGSSHCRPPHAPASISGAPPSYEVPCSSGPKD